MPIKISKAVKDELDELGIDLNDYREIVICPFCYEVAGQECVAVGWEHPKHYYSCESCELVVSLQ